MRIRDWSSDVCSSYLSKRAFSLKAARRNQHLPLPFVSRRRDMMVRPAAAFALPLTLAACAVEVPPETPPPPAAAYMALGTEPGWTLEITPDRLNYDGHSDATKIVVAQPGHRPSGNAKHTATPMVASDAPTPPYTISMRHRRHTTTRPRL